MNTNSRHFAKTFSAQNVGLRAQIISVETDITKKTLHAFSVVGLPDKAIEESRDRVSAAIKNSGFKSPKSCNQKTVVSLAPADIKKAGPFFDLPIALAYLLANDDIRFNPDKKLFLGELSLDGKLRPVSGVLLLVKEAKQKGFKEVYLPKENAVEGALVEGIEIYGVGELGDVIKHLDTKQKKGGGDENSFCLNVQEKTETDNAFEQNPTNIDIDFSDVKGQETAKRGLEIAAAGGHNIAMYGPPGTGKTMLAKAFVGILPNISKEEILEITGIYSVAGKLGDKNWVSSPPFRSPHHTASYVSMVGGGAYPKPGEITLAHGGLLFLDEFLETEKRVIEALRQPLEDKIINISRAKGSETFPANFILVAAMNPCPCGNYGAKNKVCICSASEMMRYRKKLSGPIIDRIDLWVQVAQINYDKLSEPDDTQLENSQKIKERVESARGIQKRRFAKDKFKTNSNMSARYLTKQVFLSQEVRDILNKSAQKLALSPRSYHRVIKLARTIADLEKIDSIGISHILEALQYRPKQ